MFSWIEKTKWFKYEILAAWVLIIISWVFFYYGWKSNIFLFITAILGLYMAIDIWANDIANNMWPAVWSKAISIKWAIIIAAIFEAAWVILAWWDVVNTISKWIIDPNWIKNTFQFIAIMISTLAWAAIWVNIATYFKAPVSTTHSIVWWLVWAWITAIWFNVVDWYQIWMIAASWIISPLMWWIIAVLLVSSIKKNILKKEERWEAAKVWLPIYIWIMVWSFVTYLLEKWFKQVLNWTPYELLMDPEISLFIWYVIWVITFIILRIHYKKQNDIFKNWKKFINKLFNIPLIFAVALLSFAHWANDVANAIWPLAAINSIFQNDWMIISESAKIEVWIMLLWAIWLVLWLSVFWARLIKTVWSEITKLNQIRAYCVALATAITVIIASWLWLPVSSTHIALWWVFWIWLTRQYQKSKNLKRWKKEKMYIDYWMLKTIWLAWLITLPSSWIIACISYFIIMSFV